MKVCVLVLTLFLTNYFSVTAQVDELDVKILHFLDVNGTEKTYGEAYDSMCTMLRKKYTGVEVPESFWTKIQSDRAEKIGEIKKMLVFAYRNNFTAEDIEEMTNFYESATGKKWVAAPNSLTTADTLELANFKASRVGLKMESQKEALATDIKTIYQDWRRDLFIEKMTVLTKFGYKPLKPKKEKKAPKDDKYKSSNPETLKEKQKSARLANPDNEIR